MLALWFCLAFAADVEIDGEALKTIILRARPHVEARTGRTFDPVPTTVMADLDDIRDELWDHQKDHVAWLRAHEGEDAAARAVEAWRERIEHGVGFYSSKTDKMYVVADKIEANFARGGLPAELLEPYVFCVMVHELTHALQAQQPRTRGLRTEAEFKAYRAVVEGHASLVEEQTCSRGDHRTLQARRTVSGKYDAIVQRETEGATWAYGWGREFVRSVHATEGPEAVWALLTREREVTPVQIEQTVRAARPAAWAEPPVDSWLDQLLLELPGEVQVRESGTADLFSVLLPLGSLGFEFGTHVRSSHAAFARTDDLVVGVMLVAVDTPGLPAELIEARFEHRRGHVRPKPADQWLPYGRLDGVPMANRWGRSKKEPTVDLAMHWYQKTDDKQLNYTWFAGGDALLLIFNYGEPIRPGPQWSVARVALGLERTPMPTP